MFWNPLVTHVYNTSIRVGPRAVWHRIFICCQKQTKATMGSERWESIGNKLKAAIWTLVPILHLWHRFILTQKKRKQQWVPKGEEVKIIGNKLKAAHCTLVPILEPVWHRFFYVPKNRQNNNGYQKGGKVKIIGNKLRQLFACWYQSCTCVA